MGNNGQWNLSKDIYSGFVQNLPKSDTSQISLRWELTDKLWHVHATEYYTCSWCQENNGESPLLRTLGRHAVHQFMQHSCKRNTTGRGLCPAAESESTGQLPLPCSTPAPSPFLRRHWCFKKKARIWIQAPVNQFTIVSYQSCDTSTFQMSPWLLTKSIFFLNPWRKHACNVMKISISSIGQWILQIVCYLLKTLKALTYKML